MPQKKKNPRKPEAEAETAPQGHEANPPHNHGPATAKPAGFGQNRFGGNKGPRPPAPKMIVRGANRGR